MVGVTVLCAATPRSASARSQSGLPARPSSTSVCKVLPRGQLRPAISPLAQRHHRFFCCAQSGKEQHHRWHRLCGQLVARSFYGRATTPLCSALQRRTTAPHVPLLHCTGCSRPAGQVFEPPQIFAHDHWTGVLIETLQGPPCPVAVVLSLVSSVMHASGVRIRREARAGVTMWARVALSPSVVLVLACSSVCQMCYEERWNVLGCSSAPNSPLSVEPPVRTGCVRPKPQRRDGLELLQKHRGALGRCFLVHPSWARWRDSKFAKKDGSCELYRDTTVGIALRSIWPRPVHGSSCAV